MSLLSQIVPEWVTKRGRWLEKGAPAQAVTGASPIGGVILPQKFVKAWDFPLLKGELIKDGWLFPQKGKRLAGQVTEYPIFPIFDRPHPFLDWVKERDTIIPRVKFLGAAGVVDPEKVAVSPEVPLTEAQKRLAQSFKEGIAIALGVSPEMIREEPIEKWIREYSRAFVRPEYWAEIDMRRLGEQLGRIIREALRR